MSKIMHRTLRNTCIAIFNVGFDQLVSGDSATVLSTYKKIISSKSLFSIWIIHKKIQLIAKVKCIIRIYRFIYNAAQQQTIKLVFYCLVWLGKDNIPPFFFVKKSGICLLAKRELNYLIATCRWRFFLR